MHWGLPDVNGFGRREMKVSTDEARCLTLYQIGALRQIASSVGATIDHLVPHGALYPMLARDEKIGGAMVDAINSVGEPWVLYWPTPLERHRFYEIAGREGIPIIHEICIDLDYRADGSLIVERVKQARDPGYIADRIQRFVEESKLRTVDDTDLEFEAQAILLHGDGPNATEVVSAVRTTLERMQVAVAARQHARALALYRSRPRPVNLPREWVGYIRANPSHAIRKQATCPTNGTSRQVCPNACRSVHQGRDVSGRVARFHGWF